MSTKHESSGWETLDSHVVWQSRWYGLRQDRLVTPTGHEFTYTFIDHPGAVWVVPVTPDGQVVLIWHYRYAVDDWCYEVPAGGLLRDRGGRRRRQNPSPKRRRRAGPRD